MNIAMSTPSTTKRPRTTKATKAQAPKPSKAFKAVVEYAKPTAHVSSTMAATLQALSTMPATKVKEPTQPKAVKHAGLLFQLTDKGTSWLPSNSKSQDTVTWMLIRDALSGETLQLSYQDLIALVPTHRSYVGYAVKHGWLSEV